MNTPNTTFDVYLAGNLPPAAPDFSGLSGFLRDRWQLGNKVNEDDRTFFWTAILEVPLGTDLPDLWPGAISQTTIWAPDRNGEAYTVVFVERERRFPGNDFLRVYLVKGYIVAITVEQANGNPTLTAITTLLFDQADGFTVSQPAANQAQINLDVTEQAQDAVGNAMINTNTVHPFYDDPNNQLSWNVQLQMSLTSDGSGVKLVGDSASPGNSMLYGTNSSGVKGWYAQPAASSGTVTSVATGAGLTGGTITTTGTLSLDTTHANEWTGVQTFDDGDLILKGSSSGSSTLHAPATGGGALTFPAGTDTLVSLGATQTLTSKTLTLPAINGGTHTAITSLGIRSTGSGAFDLSIANSENLTAGRTLTIATNDANRLLSLAGDLTTAGAFSTSGAFGITLIATATTSITLPASGTLLPTTGNGSALTGLTYSQIGGTVPGANAATENTGTTTNAFVTVFDLSNSNGLHGSFSLKNTHVSNGISYKITGTNKYGGTVSATNVLGAGNTTPFCFDSSSVAGSSTIVPPYSEIKLEVQDSVSGSHATYDVWRSVVG